MIKPNAETIDSKELERLLEESTPGEWSFRRWDAPLGDTGDYVSEAEVRAVLPGAKYPTALALVADLTADENWQERNAALFAASKQLARELLSLRRQNEWVSVEDRLPENYASVWICWLNDDQRCTEEAQYEESGERFTLVRTDGQNNPIVKDAGEVTHWRPLPAPPTGKDNGNVQSV